MVRLIVCCILALSMLPRGTLASDSFEHLATHRGVGSMLLSLVGPGPQPGSERVYQSYIYAHGTLDIVAIDPETGQHTVFTSPVASEQGAWAMAVGPDGRLYVGTLPHAHLLRLDPRTRTLTDLGRPAATEQYIWQLTLGSDQQLYGCTYPSARLVRFDPATGHSDDLGRMDPTEQYARSIAASDDGFVYTGIGTRLAHLVAYEVATGQHRDILPAQYRVAGTASVQRGDDGKVYGEVGGQPLRLEAWQIIPIPASEVRTARPVQLRDGRIVTQAAQGVFRVYDPHPDRQTEHPFRYQGKELALFRLGFGPDGMLYASGMLPMHLVRINPQTGESTTLGELGSGEIYALLPYGPYLLGAAYSGNAPLLVYDPSKPFTLDKTKNPNPRLLEYAGQNSSWRPMAMIVGPQVDVYLGALAGYGQLGGPLTMWDLTVHQVESFPHVVEDQSVVSLTATGGLIIGGSTILGGGGSQPTQTAAKLFVWDAHSQQKLFETVPVPGAPDITDLITAPNGLVYGIAGQHTLFVFDPRAFQVIHTAPLPFQGVVYNSLGAGPDGQLWGLASQGIFTLNPRTYTGRLVARSPEPVTAGFALAGYNLYYASGAKLYRYKLPGLGPTIPPSLLFRDGEHSP